MEEKRVAIVWGGRGQAGRYLVKQLLQRGYTVHVPTRAIQIQPTELQQNLHYWPFTSRAYLINSELPDEIYNLAGETFAPASWDDPMSSLRANAGIPISILDVIVSLRKQKEVRFFQAGSAEVFSNQYLVQSEGTPKRPRNPYGVAKLAAMEAVRAFREQYGLFACTGILFNMESPLRSKFFFAEKVTSELVQIAMAIESGKEWRKLRLGKLSAWRDWGWAPEYMEVAQRMLQRSEPEDFCIGTGVSQSCLSFVEEAAFVAGLRGDLEQYVDWDQTPGPKNDCMQANVSKARELLGWAPKNLMGDVIRQLVEHYQHEARSEEGQRAIGAV